MPTPSALATQTARPEGRQSAPTPVIPFVRAANRQTLDAGIDVSRLLVAGSQQIGVFEIPATGFLRNITVLVTASNGDAGLATVAADPDAPWSVIDQISLEDPAGQPIFGPVSGYEFYLSNWAGGYEDQVDPATWAAYSAVDTDGDFRFLLHVPVEASLRDGYGSLVNQDSSAAYRLRVTLAGSAEVYTTPPDTLPSVRVQGWVNVWTQPTPTNLMGQPQEMAPPGSGTVQFWTREINPVVSGNNALRVKRVGNLVRNFVLVVRDSSGDRVASTTLPDPIRILWDTLMLQDVGQVALLTRMEAQYNGVAAPAGVYIFTYCDDLDGKPGCELRNALLPTTPATRLEFQGSFNAAGSLTVLINDILPVGLS